MIFCGQCGMQLSPGDTRCPRCGAAVESEVKGEQIHPDSPTMASSSFIPPTQADRHPGETLQQDNPQKLLLRPGIEDSAYDYGTQANYETTRRVEAPNYGTFAPGGQRTQQGMSTPYAGYPQQGASYPGFAPQGGYQQGSGVYAQQQAAAAARKKRGRSAGLILILVGLLFILSAMVLFFLQHNGTIASSGGGTSLLLANVLQYGL